MLLISPKKRKEDNIKEITKWKIMVVYVMNMVLNPINNRNRYKSKRKDAFINNEIIFS
jgi:hypothetical protein